MTSAASSPTPAGHLAALVQPPVVRTLSLTKVFKDFWRRDKVVAVQGLDLEIHPGEVFGLLGPNGSGKSTTIKMLLGLLHPTRGRISIFGRPPTDVATKARIGFLPEESYLYRFLDARETLHLYGKLFEQGRQLRTRRVEKLLEMVGLQHQARRRIGEYSKGMARRIGLAQALINDPDFLILDEPTTGMDPIGTRQIKELIRELARRGKTILLSSHLLSDVQDVCDRVCILYGGQERASGKVSTLLAQQQKTQITAPHLTDDQVRRMCAIAAEHGAPGEVEVAHPTERLEHYFVRIVEEAQAAQLRTSGVGAAQGVADFLSEAQERSVIDGLVRAADSAPQHREPAPAAEAQPSREVLNALLGTDAGVGRRDESAAAAAAPVARAAPQASPPVPEPEGDRGVIDALLNPGAQSKPAARSKDPGDG